MITKHPKHAARISNICDLVSAENEVSEYWQSLTFCGGLVKPCSGDTRELQAAYKQNAGHHASLYFAIELGDFNHK